MTNVAFLFTGIGDLSGGGGAERFFSDFFDEYLNSKPKYNLFLISDKSSLQNFNAIGNLKRKKNILLSRVFSNRFKDVLESLQIIGLIIRYKIKLIQIPLYRVQYYPILKRIDDLPAFIRPKIVITIVDSFIPYYYFDDKGRGYNYKNVYGSLFDSIQIDSVISWYELFKEFSQKNELIKSKPQIFAITSRYCGKIFNTSVAKKNHIIFASRLTIAKRPILFVEAIRILKERGVNLSDWHFYIFGKGNQEEEVKLKAEAYHLTDVLSIGHHPNLTEIFSKSKCFVSTQDFENFPSLSMNEAMASGNAIISRNVGQTHLFVKDMVNGILLKQDNENGLADAIEYYISHPEIHSGMAQQSIKLTEEVHTFNNFKNQTESFWQKTLHS